MDNHPGGGPPVRKSVQPSPAPVVLTSPPDLDRRIRQLEDKLKHYAETKEEAARLKADNERLRVELDRSRQEVRLLRVPPREGSRCQTCNMLVVKQGSPRQVSTPSLPAVSASAAVASAAVASAPAAAARAGRTMSVADDTSPRKKALPAAPPSDDEEDVAVVAAVANLRPGANDASKRGSVLMELNPAEIKKQMMHRYGGEVDLRGTRYAQLPPEPDQDEEEEDSDAPEPPPKPMRSSLQMPDAIEIPGSTPVAQLPLSTMSAVARKSNTGTTGRKSPRYMSDPGRTSIPSTASDSRDSRGSGLAASSEFEEGSPGSAATTAAAGGAGPGSHAAAFRESRKASGGSAGSLSKGTSLAFSSVFRRTTVNSMDADSSNNDTETDMVVPPDLFGGASGRSHSLMDPTESLRFRKLAIGDGGARSVTLTPINVTTINKTTYYLVRVESPDASWVVPRTYEQFRDFRQNLMFEFPTASVPQAPSKIFKNVKEKTVGDRLSWLQTFLDSLLTDSQLAGSVLLLKFLDPFYRPSPLALRAIAPIKDGMLQYRSDKTAGRALRPMLCLLKHDLYVFRSLEDQAPFEVVALDYCTIDLVAEGGDVPRFAFQIVSLKEGDTFLFAAATSKELADWLLNIREEKTKRVTFCQVEQPVTFPLVEELDKRREESIKLLQDYALDRCDEKTLAVQVADASAVLPMVKSEPETGLSVDVKGGILAATQPKLMHVVFDPRKSDKSFVAVFLVAFRYFATPLDVFAHVREKYTSGNADTRARIMFLLERWVTIHLYDFLDSLPLAKLLIDLLVLRLSTNEAAEVKNALIRKLQGHVAEGTVPPPIMPQIFRGTSFDVLDLAPLELARQITLVQHGLFAQIDARELLQDAWTGPEGATKASHVCACISNFNHLCGWISSLIVTTPPMIPRIALIHRFIDVAKCCLDLQNYNGAMAILGGLLSNPVHRLKEDWEAVPRDSQEIFAELRGLFATTGNFKAYRAAISACTAPAVPYLGLSLQDLTFLETNKDVKVIATMTMVNLEKSERINAVLSELQKFQAVQYALRPMPSVQSYVLRGRVLTAEEQDGHSYQVRPKTVATDGAGGSSPRRMVWKKEFGSPRREEPP